MGEMLLPLYMDESFMGSESEGRIFLTRFEHDFQKDCFLFHEARDCAISPEEARSISGRYQLCYAYDMFHFENREFTVEGYKEICTDIQTMIDTGFKYILVSNPYIIELLCNEYSEDLRVIVSSQLEINHAHSKIFFDVLNNTKNISYVVVSQNHLHKQEFEEMRRTFGSIELMVELDRLISDNQIVHEQFNNMLYGYYNDSVKCHIKKYIEENRRYFRKQDLVDQFDENISYKLGELGVDKKIPEKNLEHLLHNELEDIQVIDYDLWL